MGKVLLFFCGIVLLAAITLFFRLVGPEKRVYFLRLFLIVLSFIALSTILYVSFVTNSSLYTVEARSEYVEYISTEQQGRLNLANVRFINNNSPVVDSVTGSVELLPDVQVRVLRIAEGPLQIFLSLPQDTNGKLGVLDHSNGQSDTLFGETAFELSEPEAALLDGKSHLIYFEGRNLIIGKSIAKPPSSASGAVLQEGTLTANDKVIIGQARYESVRYIIGYGETLSFDTKMFNGKARGGVGFAVLDGGPGLKVGYNINADNARVGKAGLDELDQHLIVKPSLLSRLTSDSFLQTVSFLFAGLIVLTTLWTFYYDTRGYHELKKNSDL